MKRNATHDPDQLDEQLNVRVPSWLKSAVEAAALDRRQKGQSVKAADVAREILWPAFVDKRPQPAQEASAS